MNKKNIKYIMFFLTICCFITFTYASTTTYMGCGDTKGIPITKFENDVSMVSGFSTNILTNLLTLDKYSPIDVMLEKLENYKEMLNAYN